MSRSQLTLFNCSGPFSKQSRVEHATLTSSLNVEAADVATAATVSHMQSVHTDISDLSDDSSILTTNDLSMQPLTPRCSMPFFIDSSFDEASFSATFSPRKDLSHSNDNSQQSHHLTTSMANACRNTPGSTEISFSYTSISSITSVMYPAHSTCSLLVEDSASAHSQPHSVSNLAQTDLLYIAAAGSCGATASEVSTTKTIVTCLYTVPSQPSDIAQTPAFPPVRPVNIKFQQLCLATPVGL